jgi:prophage regulatory protein
MQANSSVPLILNPNRADPPITPITEILVRASLRAFGIPFSNVSLLRMERTGAFPKRFYLSEKVPAWRLSDVRAWVEARQRAAEPNTMTEKATTAKRRRRLNARGQNGSEYTNDPHA